MDSFLFDPSRDLEKIRAWQKDLPGPSSLTDFDEVIQLDAVQKRTRLWQQAGELVALAYVDNFNNLFFDITPQKTNHELEDSIVNWGIACQKTLNQQRLCHDSLDACVRADASLHLRVMQEHGFIASATRSLKYRLSLKAPLVKAPLPAGFVIRPIYGESEVEALVCLHRAAFGTQAMTVEERLSIIRTPTYRPELDLVATDAKGTLAAFCISGLEELECENIGSADPIGTHPAFQKKGLAKALIFHAAQLLKNLGATQVLTGTSSENLPMQWLAQTMGFELYREDVWFTKRLD